MTGSARRVNRRAAMRRYREEILIAAVLFALLVLYTVPSFALEAGAIP